MSLPFEIPNINPIEAMVKESVRQVVHEEIHEQLKPILEFVERLEALMTGFQVSKGMVAKAFQEAMRNGNG